MNPSILGLFLMWNNFWLFHSFVVITFWEVWAGKLAYWGVLAIGDPGWVRRWPSLLVNPMGSKEKYVLDFTNLETLYYVCPNFSEFLYYWISVYFRQTHLLQKSQIRKEPLKVGAVFSIYRWGNWGLASHLPTVTHKMRNKEFLVLKFYLHEINE